MKPLSGVVVDEKGQPIAAADVVYSWRNKERKNQTLDAKSDEQGRFTLQPPTDVGAAIWPRGEIWAGVRGRRLTHKLLFEDGKPRAEEVRLVLPEAANVPVLVVGPDGKPVPEAQVTLPVITYHEGGSRLLPEASQLCAAATTDREGKATISAFSRDELSQVRVVTDQYGTQSRYLRPSTAGEPAEIRIALRPVGRVHGRFVAPEKDLVDGVGIWLLSYPSDNNPSPDSTLAEATATSDKEGGFQIPVIAAGTIRYISVVRKPERPFLPAVPNEVAVAVGKTAEITIPFKPAVRVQGVVREAATGKPLSDVMVGVNENNGSSSSPAATGEDGHFDFLRLPGLFNMYLQFSKSRGAPAWFLHHNYQVPGGKAGFELPPIELALARGRVVDGASRTVAGAKIEKAVTKVDFQGQSVENPVVWYSEPRELSTDANGEYRAWIEVGAPYRVQIGTEGHTPQWTEWVEFAADKPPVFPDVVIDSLRSIAGRVVDRQGRPVSGATVIQSGDGPQRTQAASDNDGRFELSGYQNEAAFVFVEKEGFRFHGQPLKAGDDVESVLTRASEPPQRRLATLPDVDPAADLALARRVLKPALDALPKAIDDRDRGAVLRELVKVDPAAALDRLEALGVKGDMADMLRVEVAKHWSAEHPDDAMAIIEALDDAYSRAAGYVLSADGLPALQRELKLDWLEKARLHLRGAGDPTMRMALTGYIARLMTESGDADGARKLIATIKPDVDALPLDNVAAYVRGVTAEALATVDLPAALALIKDVKDDREYERHHGNIARILAAAHPADAVRVLKLMRNDSGREWLAVRVAYLMAPVDLTRANEVVELIATPRLRAYAEGLTAEALVDTDAAAAMAQLERTYNLLVKLAKSEEPHFNNYDTAPVLAAWFLPIVEKLQPDRVEEYLWRAISLRLPLAKQGDREEPILLSRAYLAMFLSRYDRDLARKFYGDLLDEAYRKLNSPGEYKGLFAAAAMIDPAWGVAQFEMLPNDAPNGAPNVAKARARGGLVDILSKQGEARWRAASDYLRMPMMWQGIQ